MNVAAPMSAVPAGRQLRYMYCAAAGTTPQDVPDRACLM